MATVGQEWYMTQGEDVVVLFAPDGPPVNIASWSVRWQLRPADGSAAITINKDNQSASGLQITDPVNGLIQLSINEVDTVNLTLQVSPWYWELRRFDPGASTSLARGSLYIDTANAVP